MSLPQTQVASQVSPLQAALFYHARGLQVIWFPPASKVREAPWKEYQGRRVSTAEIRLWWKNQPQANVAVVCGKLSGVSVIDVDPRSGGLDSIREHGLEFPPGARSASGRGDGGFHAWFRWPEGLTKWEPYPGIEVRGEGHCILVPPSRHPDTKGLYVWQVPLPEELESLPQLPTWAVPPPNGQRYQSGTESPSDGQEMQGMAQWREGQRNDGLFKLAASLRSKGLTKKTLLEAMKEQNLLRCDPPLPDSEVASIAKSAGRYEVKPLPAGHYNTTDLGNAERFVAQHGERVRYCYSEDQLICSIFWTGNIWRRSKHQVHALAEATVRSIWGESDKAPSAESREALAKHAHRSEGARSISNLLELVAAKLAIEISEIDRNRSLFMLGETRTELREELVMGKPNPKDFATQTANVSFDADAKCPRWLQFLEEVLPDPEVRQFVQRAVGYTMTGHIHEQCIFFLWGGGQNGKNTFMEVIAHIMGDYACPAPPDFLMNTHNEHHPTEIADLFGKRLVIAAEPNVGSQLNESLLKQLTDRRIKARRMHQNFFEFDVTHKLWLHGNHKPVIRGSDFGIWRRICLVPFTVRIAKPDKGLYGKLLAESSGILNWMIEGYKQWRTEGLNPPEKVRLATEQYRSEMDTFGQFLKERCVEGPETLAAPSDLYQEYQKWAEGQGERTISQTSFGLRLGERGFTKARDNKGSRVWIGLGLKDPSEEGKY